MVQRRKWFLIVTIGLLVTVGLAVGGSGLLQHGKSGAEAQASSRTDLPEGVAVTVEPVTARSVQRTVTVVGSLYGHEEVAVTPKVEGRIIRIRCDVGDIVRPGDTLLEIDPTDYQLAVNEARRALDLELARLGLRELPGKDFDVTMIPSVLRAAAQERNAATKLERVRQLGNRGAISQEERDQADTDFAVARANHQQARLEAETNLASIRYKVAVLDQAQQRLQDTRLTVPVPAVALPPSSTPPSSGQPPMTAPASSIEYAVSQRMVSEGETVRAAGTGGNPVFRLVIDRPLKLFCTVPERYLSEVRVGQKVDLEVEAYPQEKFHGKVARINPTVDRANRTFFIEIHVPNQDRRLRPGSFAKASILTHIDPRARTIPEEALVTFAGVTKVFVVREGKAVAVPVRPGVVVHVPQGERTRTWLEVEGDLPFETPVVTTGQAQLAEGTVVRVREAESKGAK